MAVKTESERSRLPQLPTFYHPSPLEWRKSGGIERILRRLSTFLALPRQMALTLMAEPPSPVPWRGSPPPEGELEEMINQGSARIHLNSWLAYSKKRGWYSKEKEPPCSHLVDGIFPPRLVIYGEKGEKHSFARVICSFRPLPGDLSRMGRLGVFLGREERIFIGQHGRELEITLSKRSMGCREKDFPFYIEAARSVFQEDCFNLDIWIPYTIPGGTISAKLFGALFKKSLLEIVASQV